MSEHLNVALVRRLFEAVAAGDLQTAVDAFSPDLHYYGYDTKAVLREFRGRDEFFGMIAEAMECTDESVTELQHVFPVGEALVMAHVRAHRRAKVSHETVDDDFVVAFRIENGQVTHGMDLCGPKLLAFWKRAGA